MNAMGLSILAFGTRATNQQGIFTDPGLVDLDRDLLRAGILTLAMFPTLDQEALDAVRAEEARLGEGVMFEFTPPPNGRKIPSANLMTDHLSQKTTPIHLSKNFRHVHLQETVV